MRLMQNLPSFKTVAIATFSLWLVSTIPIWLYPQSVIVNELAAPPLFIFYILTLIFIKHVTSKCDQTYRHTFKWLTWSIFIFLLDDINLTIFFMNDAPVFIRNGAYPPPLLVKIWYSGITGLDLVAYTFLLIFCFKLIKTSFWQTSLSLHVKSLFCFLFLMLFTLLILSQPQSLTLANLFSLDTYDMYLSYFLYITIFIFILYLLIHSKNQALDWLISAMVFSIATEFAAYFYAAYHMTGFEALPNSTWNLWPGLAFLAFYRMNLYKDFNFKEWFIPSNTLEAKLALRTFLIAITSLILFFIMAYAFKLINGERFLGLFMFVMLYSLFAVLISKQVARSFAKPFANLQHNMGELMSAQTIPPPPAKFEVAEFDYLQNFIYDRFVDHEKQAEKIKAMGQMAVQVAHDIRSPASAIMMLAKESINLPEEQRISLREAASRVEDIANNLLSDYQSDKKSSSEQTLMLYPAIAAIISEKRAQYRNKALDIALHAQQEAYFAHIQANDSEFKRMLSNLINNAIEAVAPEQTPHIVLELKTQGQQLFLSIRDNGQGIAPKTLKMIKAGTHASSKKQGFGLGLKQAREFMLSQQGKLDIQSKLQAGTTIVLEFKKIITPCYLAEEISVFANSEVVILDDDAAIHGAWDKRFKAYASQYALKLSHFQNGEDCLQYLKALSTDAKKTLLFLSDYELIHQNLNGLDIIEQIDDGHFILATSYYDHDDIIKRAILARAKILPKTLAPETPIALKAYQPTASHSADLVLLDDQVKLAGIIQFLASNQNKKLDVYHTPYALFDAIKTYDKATPICLDYDLGLPITGIDLSKYIHDLGFKNIYLASGYRFKQNELPNYIIALADKMALLHDMP